MIKQVFVGVNTLIRQVFVGENTCIRPVLVEVYSCINSQLMSVIYSFFAFCNNIPKWPKQISR